MHKKIVFSSMSTVHSKSVGAIVLNSRLQVLLIFQEKNKYWEFPKGKMEKGEREHDTLRREIFEETGIRNFRIIKGFRKILHYDFHYRDRHVRRSVVYFLICTNDKIRISAEHIQFVWLSVERAKIKLKHASQRQLLDEVMQTMYGI